LTVNKLSMGLAFYLILAIAVILGVIALVYFVSFHSVVRDKDLLEEANKELRENVRRLTRERFIKCPPSPEPRIKSDNLYGPK